MPLIRDNEIVENYWIVLDDESDIPINGDVMLTHARLVSDTDQLLHRQGRTGVVLPNDADIAEISEFLPMLDLIALQFPKFTDGRAYSQARILRKSYGYKGELRATGAVLADQLAFMRRVGFDSFEPDVTPDLDVWTMTSQSVSLSYQRGYDQS